MESRQGTIVVGVDGSEASSRALRWALDEARLRGSRLTAVHVWLFAGVGVRHGWFPLAYDDFRRDAEAVLAEAVAAAVETAPGVEVEQRVVEGVPAERLVAAAADAEMLVVGSRGLGGFSGLLLGSVGQQCAQHARCPVVIVPHVARSEEPAAAAGGDT